MGKLSGSVLVEGESFPCEVELKMSKEAVEAGKEWVAGLESWESEITVSNDETALLIEAAEDPVLQCRGKKAAFTVVSRRGNVLNTEDGGSAPFTA